jgi:hypothetical protein
MASRRSTGTGSKKRLTPIEEETDFMEEELTAQKAEQKAARKATRKVEKEAKRREMVEQTLKMLKSNANQAVKNDLENPSGSNHSKMVNAKRKLKGLNPITLKKGGKRKTRRHRHTSRHRRKTYKQRK